MTIDDVIIRDAIEHKKAKDPNVRIFRLDVAGATYWVKLPRIHEKWTDRFRGDPDAVLEQEKRDLKALAALGQPVPKVVAESSEYLVTADNGIAIDIIWVDQSERRAEVVASAAKAMARLHNANCIHGAPHLRNLTWIDTHVGFIDIERAIIGTASARDKAWDIGKFLYALYGTGAPEAIVKATLEVYRPDADPGVMEELVLWQKRLRRWKLLARAPAWHERTRRPKRNPRIYQAYLEMMQLDLRPS